MSRESLATETPSADGQSSTKKLAACHACRDRKTRCVGFPVCQYCAKNNLLCSRSEDQLPTPLDQWGQQIISAIHAAKTDVISASSGRTTSALQFARTRHECSATEPASFGFYSHSGFQGLPSEQRPTDISANSRTHQGTNTVDTSLDAVTRWPDWRVTFNDIPALLLKFSRPTAKEHEDSSSASASTSLADLKRWQSSFNDRFNYCCPIVNPAHLRQMTTITAEEGPGWNSGTCLLLLVCALGAKCCFEAHASQLSQDPARRYWLMAKRRLGWALDEDSVVSSHCFALASLWHLHNFEPHKARKMLDLAISTARSSPSDSSNVIAVCSTLYSKVHLGLGISLLSTRTADLHSKSADILRPPNTDHNESAFNGQGSPANVVSGAWNSLCSIHSQCLHFIEEMPHDPSWQTLFHIFRQLSGLSLQLDSWVHTCPESLKALTADPAVSDDSHTFQPSSTQERLQYDDGGDLTILFRDVKLLLLIPAVFFIISPMLSRRLSEPTCPSLQAKQFLDRITTDANAYLRHAIACVHDAIAHNIQSQPVPLTPAWTSMEHDLRYDNTDQRPATERCHHLQRWLLFRCAFRYTIPILAALRAHEEIATAGTSDVAPSAGLRVPPDAKSLVESLAQALCTHYEDTDLWTSGQLLLRLCQNIEMSATRRPADDSGCAFIGR